MKRVGISDVGKSVGEPNPIVPQIFGCVDMDLIRLPRKTSKARKKVPVP